MCDKPVLQQPDFTKPFIVLTDTSAYGMRAILLQEGEINLQKPIKKPKLHPITYYPATFTATERGYDIYERELLTIIKAITHWRPYLIWTEEPFTIHTDHANLLYWKSPENSTDAQQDGMQNYKTTTLSLNMYLGRPHCS